MHEHKPRQYFHCDFDDPAAAGPEYVLRGLVHVGCKFVVLCGPGGHCLSE